MAPDQPQPFYTPVSVEPSEPSPDSAPTTGPGAASPKAAVSSGAAGSPAAGPTTAQAGGSGGEPIGVTPARGPEKYAKTPHFTEAAASHPLVAQFTALYHSAMSNAKRGNDEQARTDYTAMLKIYNQLAALPELYDMNKEIAHFCLQDVYDTVSRVGDPNVSRLSFGALLGITVILLLIGGMLVANPGVVGLVTGKAILSSESSGPRWVGGPAALTITGPTSIHLKPLFTSGDDALPTSTNPPLTYLATSSDTLDAVVSGEYATLIPKYGWQGTTRITLIAARNDDPRIKTSVPVDVTLNDR